MNVAVVGATGAVGETILRVLEERRLPVGELADVCLAHASRGGGAFSRETPRRARPPRSKRLQASTSSSSRAVKTQAKPMPPRCWNADRSSSTTARRSACGAGVPLIVPDVNRRDAARGATAFPGRELHGDRALHRVAARFATSPACAPFESQRIKRPAAPGGPGSTSCAPANARSSRVKIEPAPPFSREHLARNVVPQIGAFDESGWCGEERKIARRDAQDARASGICSSARPPSACRFAPRIAKRYSSKPSARRRVEALAAAFDGCAGIGLSPRRHRDAARGRRHRRRARRSLARRTADSSFYASRHRASSSGRQSTHNFTFWCVGDQLRKGAATNAVADSRAAACEGVRRRVNAAPRRVAVLKFGGTSVATARAARRSPSSGSAMRSTDGFATVAVVSAMGRAPDAVCDRHAARRSSSGRGGTRERRSAAGRRAN